MCLRHAAAPDGSNSPGNHDRSAGVVAGSGVMNDPTLYLGRRLSAWSPDDDLVGLQPEDARHHTYILGQTGSGKSTLLRNLALQHLHAGRGFALLDPHGDLAEEILAQFPSHRADDLVYFNPGDLEFPIGLNLLAQVPRDRRHLVASGIVSALKSLWRDSWGPRLEYILLNALLALLDCQNVSLLGVTRMLVDERYREWVVRQVQDTQVRAFWEQEFASYDPRFLREAIAPVQNKVGQFLLNPPIRNILGQTRASVDFRFLMDTGRVFIANLSKGRLGAEPANLLGSLLVNQFQLAAMARTDQPEAERRDFHLLVDEFHNYTTDSFATALAEARKYRLCLTLAHQYGAQLGETVRDAVFGNVGTMVVFRVGHADAAVFEQEFGGAVAASQFADLDRFHAHVRLLESGVTREPFLIRTLPPMDQRHARRDRLVRRCRERFASPRAEVERKLKQWLEGIG